MANPYMSPVPSPLDFDPMPVLGQGPLASTMPATGPAMAVLGAGPVDLAALELPRPGEARLAPAPSAPRAVPLASALAQFGIGAPPPPMALHDHVLSPFAPEEAGALATTLRRSAEAIRVILKNGLAAAMNEFNKEGL